MRVSLHGDSKPFLFINKFVASRKRLICSDWVRCTVGDVAAWRVVAFSASALVGIPATWASDGETSGSRQAQPSFSDAWKQITDPGGIRSRLEQAGLQFTFTYYGDALGNLSGGVQQGLGYSGRFGAVVDADLEKLVGWSGAAFHASIHQIHGSGLSANNLENLTVVSGIETLASSRLFNLWIEQKLGSNTNLRVGQITAAQEFLVSQNANLFVNSTVRSRRRKSSWSAKMPICSSTRLSAGRHSRHRIFRAAVPLIRKPLRGLG